MSCNCEQVSNVNCFFTCFIFEAEQFLNSFLLGLEVTPLPLCSKSGFRVALNFVFFSKTAFEIFIQ